MKPKSDLAFFLVGFSVVSAEIFAALFSSAPWSALTLSAIFAPMGGIASLLFAKFYPVIRKGIRMSKEE